MRKPRVSLLAFIAVLIGSCTPAAVLAANETPSTLTWHVRAGTDVIGERFRLVETDTLDLTTEYRGQLQTTWRYRGDDWTNILVDNRLGIGTLSARHDLDMRASRRLGPRWSIDLSGITAYRHYLDSADGIRSDFAEGRFVTTIRRGGRNALRTWGIEQGIEGLAYEQDSPLFLDGVRHWHGFVYDSRRGLDFVGARAAVEHEVVPDSSGLNSWGIVADAYTMRSLGDSWMLSGDGSVIGRRYRDTSARPHSVDVYTNGRLAYRLTPSWSVEGTLGVTGNIYSPADSIYYDLYHFQPTIELVWWPLWGQVRVGPAFAVQQSPTVSSDDYTQWGATAGTNLFSIRHGFLDATVTVGRRNYANDAEAYLSDYLYWDGTLALTTYLPWGIDLDSFVLVRTERHKESGDNSTSVLFTLNLSRKLF